MSRNIPAGPYDLSVWTSMEGDFLGEALFAPDGESSDVYIARDSYTIEDTRERVLDELTAYQMVSIMQGVAVRGTGARLASLNKNLAGKTGTTNENKDAWFMGFSPDLVVGIYVGFDEPRTLGKVETGANAALPIFYDFMKEALKDKPNLEFRVPKGIKFVRVNPKTGKPASLDDEVVIIEALKPDFEFNNNQRVIGDDGTPMLESNEDNDFELGNEY